MSLLRPWFLRPRNKRLVRPWALLAPVVVLLVTLPLLRPLRHPDPRRVSDDETARLATVQAIVEHGTLAIEETEFNTTRTAVWRGHSLYADQPPMMAALLSPSYWVMNRLGLTFANHGLLVTYLLTLLGVTLPVAGAAGLVYRMGRLFELKRPWRAGLALAVVFGSGLISYATVLNPHAPAAALVLSSAACFIHVTITNRRVHSSVWLLLAGLCAALAATIDPAALVFLALFPLIVLALRWPVPHRVAGLLIYLAGIAPPLLLHAELTGSLTGGWGFYLAESESPSAVPVADVWDVEEEPAPPQGFVAAALVGMGQFAEALTGPHGALSHFPVILVGILGVTMIMHRHWPATTKWLAVVSLAGGLAVILAYGVWRLDRADPMFAARWYVVFLPLVLFWAGAWLRRRHRPASWAVAGVLLTFSIAVSLLGATGPMPRGGFGARGDGSARYTAAGAARHLVHPPPPHPTPDPHPALAGRYRPGAAPTSPTAAVSPRPEN